MRKTRASSTRRASIPGPRPEPRPEVAAALAVLPAAQRRILRLRLVEGLSAEEVAERLSTTPSAVRVAQHRALEALRAHLRA